MWLNEQEQKTLAGLALIGVMGLGVLWWQQQQPALTIKDAPTPAQMVQWDAAMARARIIDVNTADATALERLPGVGPILAQRIVEYRAAHGRFPTTQAIGQVPGIGPTLSKQLSEYLAVSPSATGGSVTSDWGGDHG